MKLSVNKPGASNPDPLRLSIVDPDPTSSPLVLDARVTDISDELRGKLISKDVDGEGGLGPSKCSNGVDDDSDADETGGGTDAADDDCEKDLAQMVFNACPTGSDIEVVASGCSGIGAIEFKATNALVGDPLPQPVPSTGSIGGVTQDFSFIQRGDLFRAQGTIGQLKKIGLSQVDKSAQANPSATTRIGAAFGSGAPTEKIRAYVDTDSRRRAAARRRGDLRGARPGSRSACATRSRPARTSRRTRRRTSTATRRRPTSSRCRRRSRSPRHRTSPTSTSASCASARAAGRAS